MVFSPDLQARAYWKKTAFDKPEEEITPQDVMVAATNIYQDEFGLMFEDGADEELWANARSLYHKHRGQAKDRSDLVDMIVQDLHGDTPTVFEQLRQDGDHGAQPTKGDF